MTKARVRMLVVVASIVAALASVGATAAAPASAETAGSFQQIRIVIYAGQLVSSEPYLAGALHFFQKQGIAVKYLVAPSGPVALQLLASNQADFVLLDVVGLANALKAGINLREVIGLYNRFNVSLQCRNDSGISGTYPSVMKELVGKKVGVSGPGGTPDTFLRYSLIKAGVNPSTVSIITTGGSATSVAALQAGAVDCIMGSQPTQEQTQSFATSIINYIKGQGPAELGGNYVVSALTTTPTFISKNPALVRRVALAIKQAIIFAQNPKDTGTLLAKLVPWYTGLDAPTLKAALLGTLPGYSYIITPQAVANAFAVYNAINPSSPLNLPFNQVVSPVALDLMKPAK
jgi:NitT/TauT family transport system substrate-binding protein